MPRPLRLCFFARTLPAHRAGKGMFHPHIAATALACRGHEVTILSTSHPQLTEESPLPNLHILYLPGTPADQYSDTFFKTSAQVFDRLHAMSPFDAAISDSASAAGLPRFSAHKIPIVTVSHAGLDMISTEASRQFFRETQHPLLTASAAIICDATHVAASIIRGLPEVAPRIRVIHNSADPALFDVSSADTAALRKELGLSDRPILLYLGRMVKEKGGEDLIRAVSMLPDGTGAKDGGPRPQLVMVGPGAYGAELRNIASALAVPLTLIPGVEHSQTPRYLSLADIFILPTWHTEGLPFSLVEAMFCKRPIIASDIGGVSEIIRPEQTGLLTPPRNPAALAAAIQRLLTDKQTRARLAASGHALAHAMFSLDAMTNRFEQLLSQLTTGRFADAQQAASSQPTQARQKPARAKPRAA